jgi:hypothetical protein
MSDGGFTTEDLPRFDRRSVELRAPFSRIGSGRLGGKAQGLVFIRETIESRLDGDTFPGITIDIPPLAVVATDVFDAFMEGNGLYEIANAELSDDEIANAFQQADLPQEIVGDLEALIDQVHTPLAVRSSSLLEDDRFEPFAGVYQTKMIPNNQPDRSSRLRRLAEAIKFVYASTYFKAAKNYIRATEKVVTTEKMAVIIQMAVGHQHNGRYYPQVSGVGRSFNFYPLGTGKPEEGVVNLVLGLGKTIMDGDLAWSYSPERPLAPPPFASPHDRLKGTQTRFWAVRMAPPAEPNPIAETEFLVKVACRREQPPPARAWSISPPCLCWASTRSTRPSRPCWRSASSGSDHRSRSSLPRRFPSRAQMPKRVLPSCRSGRWPCRTSGSTSPTRS